MDVGQALLGGNPVGLGPGFGEVAALHDNPRAEALRGADFDQRRIVGHDHRDRNAEQLAVIREGGGVIAGGGGDDPAFLLVAGEAQQGVARAALLERARALQVVEFAENAGAGDFRQGDRFRTGGNDHAARDAAAGGANVCEGDGRVVFNGAVLARGRLRATKMRPA